MGKSPESLRARSRYDRLSSQLVPGASAASWTEPPQRPTKAESMRPWTLRSGGSHGGSHRKWGEFDGFFMDFMKKNEGKLRSRPDSYGDLTKSSWWWMTKEKVISMGDFTEELSVNELDHPNGHSEKGKMIICQWIYQGVNWYIYI